jgi:2-polyprenyl-3-methyl-5-hydroxy-6-metoxy-1,4-benzoquinol methylase
MTSSFPYGLLDKGLVPDVLLRLAIRFLLRQRLREIDRGSLHANHAAKMKWIEDVRARTAIADVTEKANQQHYQVSTSFILSTLGPCAKYSCCLYPTGKESLEEAEILMLESYCEKAQLKDGIDILDLGCGWGSLSLYLAKVLWSMATVSISHRQRNIPTLESLVCPTRQLRKYT